MKNIIIKFIMKQYIYIINYEKLGLNQSIKIGSTKYPHSRLCSYQTHIFINVEYYKLYQVKHNNLNCYQIDDLIQETFEKDKTNVITGEGGTEWYQADRINSKILEKFFNKNNIKFEHVNINDLVKCPRETEESLKNYINNELFSIFKESLILKNKFNSINNTNVIARDYQTIIIKSLIDFLKKKKKVYLELATGAGKTFITFEILKKIMPEIIVCFSPRTKINTQNISKKYLNKLDNKYYPINFSKNKNIKELYLKHKKIIITCCTQSADNLYNFIKDLNSHNIFVWFDEAHWGVEDTWLNSEKESIEFWLHDNMKIKQRLFTSASPDNNIVTSYPKTFGELYSPIKIKELIEQKWLCSIKPYIFETPEKDNVNLSKYIIDNFTKLNKNYGLSFHSRTSNAYKLFKHHFNKYNLNETDIKPFLIIGDNNTTVNKKVNEIIKTYNDYDFTNLDIFMNTKNSIAYTVKKLDMGWDFSELDFICFSDSKLSSKDIIQCIGRGTRPDKLGNKGRNLNKILSVLLPVFVNNINEKNDFSQIINVIKYLIMDIGLDIKKAIINKNTPKEYEIKNSENVDYNGSDEIGAQLLKLLGYKNNLKELYGIMRKHKIYNDKDYEEFIKSNKQLKLKNQVYDYEGFKWKQVVDINGDKYYETYQECINAKSILSRNKDFKNKIKRLNWSKLNKFDSKIPPYDKLKEYYY